MYPVYFLNNPNNRVSIVSLEEITHSLLKISHQDNFNSFQPKVSPFLHFMLLLSAIFCGLLCTAFLDIHSSCAHGSLSPSFVNYIQHFQPFQTHFTALLDLGKTSSFFGGIFFLHLHPSHLSLCFIVPLYLKISNWPTDLLKEREQRQQTTE